MKMHWFLFLFPSLFFSVSAIGKIRLPAAVGSNMVLQQQSKIAIWGWSDPGEKIYVTTSWDNNFDSTEATGAAKWKININTPTAGGPYTITLRGHNTIVLHNILIGEVWVCSGQSNMEWSSYHNLKQIIDELPHAGNNNIRLFHVTKTTSSFPQDDLPGEWKVCSSESLKGLVPWVIFLEKNGSKSLVSRSA